MKKALRARSAQGVPYEDEAKNGATMRHTMVRAVAIAMVTVILCVLVLAITWRVLAGHTGGRVVEQALLDSGGSNNDSEAHAHRSRVDPDPYEAMFRDSVETSASPCSNFYQYACGAWIRNHNLSSAAEMGRKLTQVAIRRIRAEKVATRQGEVVGQAARFFETCLDAGSAGVDLDGVAAGDVKNVLAEAGLTWPERSERSDFVSSLFFMARRVALPLFFGIEAGYAENGLRAIFFPLDVPFQRIMRRFRQHMKTGRDREDVRAAYETLTEGAVDGQRCADVLRAMHAMTRVLDLYVGAVDKKREVEVASLTMHAPTVASEKWGSLLLRYHEGYFSDVEAVVIYDVASFAAIFEALRTRGEETMNDLLGFMSVLAAVHYTNTSFRDTFFGSANEAVDHQEQYCFVRAYKFYEHALNHFLLEGATRALEEFGRLVEKMRGSFARLIHVNGNVPSGLPPLSQGYNVRSVFEHVEKSRAEFYVPHYARYPNLTASALVNWMALVEHLRKVRAPSSRELAGIGSEHDWAGLCETAFYKWRLSPCHLGFPWYVANGHRVVFIAGLGARVAAALFLDYVDRNATSRVEVYRRNHACLRASAALAESPVDLGLQASVVGVRAAWRMYEEESTANDSLFSDVGPVPSSRVFFLHGCHLLCGDGAGPRMCNVPLRHNADFARVFACRRGSGMNPEKKCTMVA